MTGPDVGHFIIKYTINFGLGTLSNMQEREYIKQSSTSTKHPPMATRENVFVCLILSGSSLAINYFQLNAI